MNKIKHIWMGLGVTFRIFICCFLIIFLGKAFDKH